jgi:DNA invertase Pin-like site-specific DNA recombinase
VSLNVGFVSLSEALDLAAPSGRALAGMLAVFAEFERDILRDRVKAGITQARKEGRPHGRPPAVTKSDADASNSGGLLKKDHRNSRHQAAARTETKKWARKDARLYQRQVSSVLFLS